MKNYQIFIFCLLPILGDAGCNSQPSDFPDHRKAIDFKAIDFVNPMIGTGFHGHTFPGAVVPHGRVQLSPDTHIMGWDASSGYHYDDTTLYGFSHTHLSGTGIGDLGDILFLPFTGEVGKEKPVAILDHRSEDASPGYYKIEVKPWNIHAELTATVRTGWHRYTYPEGEGMKLMIDLSHILQPNWGHRLIDSELKMVDDYTVEGYRLTSGWAAEDPIWFRCEFNLPIQELNMITEKAEKGKGVIAYFTFPNQHQPLEAKVSISSVDQEGANGNMNELIPLSSFDAVVEAAEREWEKELSTIQIETQDKDILNNFYSALYHSKIAPMVFNDVDGRYRGIDRKIHQIENGNTYTVYSLWDVFRSWYPLMTVTNPERARAWAYDLYLHQQLGGLLPKWALNGNYTGTMVGYPANAILADAMVKGMTDSLGEELVKAAEKSAAWQPDFYEKHQGTRAAEVMPKQIYYKEKLGFVPSDSTNGSVSYGLEMAYYDWCVARMAEKAGNEDLADKFFRKGKAYREYFDPEVGFMRGKNGDGSRSLDFNPRHSDHEHSDYIEGNAWQWTPLVLHDLEGFRDLLGGEEALGVWLDSLFMTSSVIEGENASGDITGLIGQYAHGNEPSHHVPFIYQYSDRPWRTQEVLNQILFDFYAPDPGGIIGNEDCGQMSAWYVLNALGIYQVTPGDPTFTIGRPIIDRARIKVKNGWFEIVITNNSAENMYIDSAILDGKPLTGLTLHYDEIIKGGRLEITMASSYKE
ncbi:MAG: GH92 family glycosyl hydrolase [Bacteroidia bacterium]